MNLNEWLGSATRGRHSTTFDRHFATLHRTRRNSPQPQRIREFAIWPMIWGASFLARAENDGHGSDMQKRVTNTCSPNTRATINHRNQQRVGSQFGKRSYNHPNMFLIAGVVLIMMHIAHITHESSDSLIRHWYTHWCRHPMILNDVLTAGNVNKQYSS